MKGKIKLLVTLILSAIYIEYIVHYNSVYYSLDYEDAITWACQHPIGYPLLLLTLICFFFFSFVDEILDDVKI